jgi:hypothetical protein
MLTDGIQYSSGQKNTHASIAKNWGGSTEFTSIRSRLCFRRGSLRPLCSDSRFRMFRGFAAGLTTRATFETRVPRA